MKRSVGAGLRGSFPIAAGYFPVAVTFGLLARGAGLSAWEAGASSLVVFAGAAQFMAVGMFNQGIAVFQIVFATFLLNFRHVLMSSVIVHRLTVPERQPSRWLIAFGVTDETFAVATQDTEIDPRYLLGLEIGAYTAWFTGTMTGAIVGTILPSVVRDALGFALYALFMALLLGHLENDRRLLLPALTAAAVNTMLRYALHLGAGAAFPVAMIVGAAAGFLLPEREGQSP